MDSVADLLTVSLVTVNHSQLFYPSPPRNGVRRLGRFCSYVDRSIPLGKMFQSLVKRRLPTDETRPLRLGVPRWQDLISNRTPEGRKLARSSRSIPNMSAYRNLDGTLFLLAVPLNFFSVVVDVVIIIIIRRNDPVTITRITTTVTIRLLTICNISIIFILIIILITTIISITTTVSPVRCSRPRDEVTCMFCV